MTAGPRNLQVRFRLAARGRGGLVSRAGSDRPRGTEGPGECHAASRRSRTVWNRRRALRTEQIGAAVGLALLATLAASRTAQTGSLAAGYDFSFLVAVGLVLIAMVLVATQLNHQACQTELARQRQEAASIRAKAPLPQEVKKP